MHSAVHNAPIDGASPAPAAVRAFRPLPLAGLALLRLLLPQGSR